MVRFILGLVLGYLLYVLAVCNIYNILTYDIWFSRKIIKCHFLKTPPRRLYLVIFIRLLRCVFFGCIPLFVAVWLNCFSIAMGSALAFAVVLNNNTIKLSHYIFNYQLILSEELVSMAEFDKNNVLINADEIKYFIALMNL